MSDRMPHGDWCTDNAVIRDVSFVLSFSFFLITLMTSVLPYGSDRIFIPEARLKSLVPFWSQID